MLKRLDKFRVIIPKDYKKNMLIEGLIFGDDEIIEQIKKDHTIDQIANVACLPGMLGKSLAMPDAHQGYGFCIGGVSASDMNNGIISAGGVGYDINCGVRLLRTNLYYDDVQDKIKDITDLLFRDIPSGTGKGGRIILQAKDMDDVLRIGAKWAIQNGYGIDEDLEYIEDHGQLKNSDPSKVSDRAKKRGNDQLGTLGSGNHFVEVQRVVEVYNSGVAKNFGIEKDQIVILIHSGSRGLGHQVCTEYIEIMKRSMTKNKLNVNDRELACSPIDSREGQDYLNAMGSSANYAFANRQCMSHWIRLAFQRIFGASTKIDLVYDVCHNIAKIENHTFGRITKDVLVHRKGATRAFPKESVYIPVKYKPSGQPVLIPGSMGTCSYILVGLPKAMEESFGSVCHGAGRLMSRIGAKKSINIEQLKLELKEHGVYVRGASNAGLLEEHPHAYKDVSQVVDVVDGAGLAGKVAKMVPLGVIKG